MNAPHKTTKLFKGGPLAEKYLETNINTITYRHKVISESRFSVYTLVDDTFVFQGFEADDEPRQLAELTFPTCADVIAVLSATPNAPFRISDPDTGWTISIFDILQDPNGTVRVTADYEDMDAEEPDGVER